MRIVSGVAGGIRLHAPRGTVVRPTEDRVKESLFGALGDLSGARVLDLFAGTGALGLEALSRGAASVVFVERSRQVLPFLRDNIAAVEKSMAGTAGTTRVVCSAVERAWAALKADGDGFDLVFADPPYRVPAGEFGAGDLLLSETFAGLSADAVLVLEHSSAVSLPWFPRSSWAVVRQKRYGGTVISFARLHS